ncbi:MAG: ABC transporter ATP-binding protein, partial [Tabrizicola sp.]|nr:ABC transporter ATP-binding protein [Tabrizicola sp.]
PNSIFVAGFIGSPKMNFLTGKFAEAHGCMTLGARSEHIDVVENGPWSGEVLHVEDLGSDHYIFVEIGSDEPIIVRRPGKATIEVGTKVSLAPQAANLHRFDADGKPIR